MPLSELQPGDLVTYYSPVSHVAMYIGGGQVIHASTESTPVYITTVSGGGPNPTGHRVTADASNLRPGYARREPNRSPVRDDPSGSIRTGDLPFAATCAAEGLGPTPCGERC